MVEWQTRRLAMCIASTVPVNSETGQNPLMDFAIDSYLESPEEEKARMQRERTAEPEVGSFERGMSALGGMFG